MYEMEDSQVTPEAKVYEQRDALVEELFEKIIGAMEVATIYLVLRSSKAVHKRTPPMPRRFGRTTPHPQGLAFRFSCRVATLVARGRSRSYPQSTVRRRPVAGGIHATRELDEVEPRRSLGDESVLSSILGCPSSHFLISGRCRGSLDYRRSGR